MTAQDLILYLLTFWYRIFRRIDYKEARPIESEPRKAVAQQDSSADNDPIRDSLDRATLDQFRISTLLKNERYYRDSRQWQKLRNCYHPNSSKTRIHVGAYVIIHQKKGC